MMFGQQTQGLPFKQTVFIKIRSEQPDKYKPAVFQVDSIREILLQMNWSVQNKRVINRTFMNVESMSIFNKGVIIQEMTPGKTWQVEILRSTPLEYGYIIVDAKQKQKKNYVNYSYQKNMFYSWPGCLFQTFGYKAISQLDLKNVEYFANKMKGIEVFLYPEQGYIQITETFPGDIQKESRVSGGCIVCQRLKGFVLQDEVIISQYTFLPEDFRQTFEGQAIKLLG